MVKSELNRNVMEKFIGFIVRFIIFIFIFLISVIERKNFIKGGIERLNAQDKT